MNDAVITAVITGMLSLKWVCSSYAGGRRANQCNKPPD